MAAFFVIQYFRWHYGDGLVMAFHKAVNTVAGFLNYFSVLELSRTLFSPWHRIAESYGRGFDAGEFFFTLAGNTISRVLGAIVRAVVVAAGLVVSFLSFIWAIVFVVAWILSPFIVAALFVGGIIIIFT